MKSQVTFNPESIIRPCEWYFPGHPDVLADCLASSVSGQISRWGDEAIGEVKVSIDADHVYVTGNYSLPDGSYPPSLHSSASKVWVNAGYRVDSHWEPFPNALKIVDSITYSKSSDSRRDLSLISGPQVALNGYAYNCEGTHFLPPEHWFARNLARTLFNETETNLALCPNGSVYVELKESIQNGQRQFLLNRVVARIRPKTRPDNGECFERLKQHIKFHIQKGYETFGLTREMPAEDDIELDMSDQGISPQFSYSSGSSRVFRTQLNAGLRSPAIDSPYVGLDNSRLPLHYAHLPRLIALDLVRSSGMHEVEVMLRLSRDKEFRIISILTSDGPLAEENWPEINSTSIEELLQRAKDSESISKCPIHWGRYYPEVSHFSPAYNYLMLERGGQEISWGEGTRKNVLSQIAESCKLPNDDYKW